MGPGTFKSTGGERSSWTLGTLGAERKLILMNSPEMSMASTFPLDTRRKETIGWDGT